MYRAVWSMLIVLLCASVPGAAAAAAGDGEPRAEVPVEAAAGDGNTSPAASAATAADADEPRAALPSAAADHADGPQEAAGDADVPGLSVLFYLAAAQRTEARAAYADAVARLHADAEVLAQFGLASLDDVMQLDQLRLAAAEELAAASDAEADARSRMEDRLASAAADAGAGVPVPDGGSETHVPADGGNAAAPDPIDGAAPEPASVLEALRQADHSASQACLRTEDVRLLMQAGLKPAVSLTEALAGCLHAELARIDAQEKLAGALLTGGDDGGRQPMPLTALLDELREHDPALHAKWLRLLTNHPADGAGCPPAAAPTAEVHAAAVRPADAAGRTAEPLPHCAIRPAGLQPAEAPPYRTAAGIVYVPLRPFAASFGYELEWIAAEQRVVLLNRENRLSFVLGGTELDVNGRRVNTEHAALPAGGQCYIPAEFLRALFGLVLLWDDEARSGLLLPEQV